MLSELFDWTCFQLFEPSSEAFQIRFLNTFLFLLECECCWESCSVITSLLLYGETQLETTGFLDIMDMVQCCRTIREICDVNGRKKLKIFSM